MRTIILLIVVISVISVRNKETTDYTDFSNKNSIILKFGTEKIQLPRITLITGIFSLTTD